jgi:hypothetical protein
VTGPWTLFDALMKWVIIPMVAMLWVHNQKIGAHEKEVLRIMTLLSEPLDYQKQLLVRVIGFEHQLVLAGDLALVGLDQRVCRVRQLRAVATGLWTLFAALFDQPFGIRDLMPF